VFAVERFLPKDPEPITVAEPATTSDSATKGNGNG